MLGSVARICWPCSPRCREAEEQKEGGFPENVVLENPRLLYGEYYLPRICKREDPKNHLTRPLTVPDATPDFTVVSAA